MPLHKLQALKFCLLALFFFVPAAAAQGASSGPDVIVQPATIQPLQTRIEALGTVIANESINLTSNVTKTVTRINFDDGQRVNKGDVLVQMTSNEEEALLAEAGFTREEAGKQLERVRSLVARDAASRSLLDQRQREYEAAGARYKAIESRLQDLRVFYNLSGVVGLRNISVGALVSPGDVITTLNDDSRMKLDFTVPSVYLKNLKVGLPIRARSRDLGDQVVEGEVFSIDNRIDTVTRAITVRAILPNENRELKQGMLMSLELHTDHRDALVISESALIPLGSQNFVFVIRKEGEDTRVERIPVTIGQRLQGSVEILAGLAEGDLVVTHGLQKIRSGQSVNVIAEQTGRESLVDLLNRKRL